MIDIAPALEIALFAALALIAVAGALGMTTTMSMFRSGVFLMASFIGVAGLFILLSADLLGLLQVMMYVGGMLVMILFMVLFSHDPGGERMSSTMDLSGLARVFSAGLSHRAAKGGQGQHGDMDMSMTTPMKRPAAILAGLTGLGLLALVAFRPAWPVVSALPDPDAPARVGHLLMGKYMIAFEGAGLLILLGIFGAVYLARPDSHPGPADRERLEAAADAPPAPAGEEDAP